MKKIVIPIFIIFLATVTFIACRKNEASIDAEKNFNKESVKEWFNTKFKQQAEYKENERSGVIKIPLWNHGLSYNIGTTQFIEYPLETNMKKIIIIGNENEAQRRQIADATRQKILFIKEANKPIQVRIIQLIPEYEYLSRNQASFNKLTFKDFGESFKGQYYVYNYAGKMIKGLLYNYKGVRTLSFSNKPSQTASSINGNTETNGGAIITNP